MERLSKIFQPITAIGKNHQQANKDFTSKSYRLMIELGIIQQALPGCFHILPMGLRALNKIVNIVDEEMQRIGAQKTCFPTLVKHNLWELSGRASEMGPEVITLKDRHDKKYILGPTHEETAANLISTLGTTSYKKFPLLLYQITSKFRDELKPRFGLIRGREFLMKDMYSFDVDQENSLKTYNIVCQSYDRVFQRIGVDFVKVLGDSGAMGGNLSHEYHYPAAIGDDKILLCHQCNHASNTELTEKRQCSKCGESENISIESAIEVGHTFLLGDKYSKPLKSVYLNENGKPQDLQMGSYGIGVSRILGAVLECLSSEEELRWPDSIAPYNVVIVTPKKGSKEDQLIGNLGENLYRNLQSFMPHLKNDIILDDRTEWTIGRRLIDCKRTGIRFIVVLNKNSCETPPRYELNDIVKNVQLNLHESDIVSYINKNGQMDNERLKSSGN